MTTQILAVAQKVSLRTFRTPLLPHKESLSTMVMRMKREMMRTSKVRVKVKVKMNDTDDEDLSQYGISKSKAM